MLGDGVVKSVDGHGNGGWHALATMAANPLTPEERAQLQCAKVGDFTGLCTRDESGNWVRL